MSLKNIVDFYPLTPMQQGMLFHTLYAPESGVYFQQLSCTLRGQLDAAIFKQAWQTIVERHPALRTALLWDGVAEPVQMVHRTVELAWQQHDWREADTLEQHERFQSFLETDRRRGFELSRAPLMRWALIQVADQAYRFVWSFHHALLDGWSMHLLLKEVLAVYEGALRGRPVQLHPSLPYRSYVSWLRQQDMGEAETFWRRTLEGVNSPTPLGIDRVPLGCKPCVNSSA